MIEHVIKFIFDGHVYGAEQRDLDRPRAVRPINYDTQPDGFFPHRNHLGKRIVMAAEVQSR